MDEDDNAHDDKISTYDPAHGWEPSELDRLDQPPVEVFAAIEGQRMQLAEYLRSGKPLSLYTIEAIAAWMARELPPTRRPGRPHGTPRNRRHKAVGLALIELEYKRRYEAAGRPRGKANQIADEVAEQFGLSLTAFMDYRRRSKAQRHKTAELLPPLEEMWWEWKAQQ